MNFSKSHQKVYLKELFLELKNRFNSAKKSNNFENKILMYVGLIESVAFVKYPGKTSSDRFIDVIKEYSNSNLNKRQIKWIYKTIRCSIVHYGFIPSLSINRNITQTPINIDIINKSHTIFSIPLIQFENLVKNTIINVEKEFKQNSSDFENDFVKLKYKVCNSCKNYFIDKSTNGCPFCSEES